MNSKTIDGTRIALENCPESTKVFALIGQIVVFAIVYAFFAKITREITLSIWGKDIDELNRDERANLNLITIFFPLVWVILVVGIPIYWVVKMIMLPFVAAEKRDLRILRRDIKEDIERAVNKSVVPELKAKFNNGDLITGIRGNPDNYKHLNEGCVCKVVSTNEKGQMQLVLVSHKDLKEHLDSIGKTFKAPSRNFIKYPRKKAVKRTAKKATKRTTTKAKKKK